MNRLTEVQLREKLLEGMCIAAQGEKFMGIDCSREPWEKFIPNVLVNQDF